MLQFIQDLPDNYEYGILWWGQSNARPWGTKAEGFSEAPHLDRRNKAGIDTTLFGFSGTSSATGAGAPHLTIAGTPWAVNQWVGRAVISGSSTGVIVSNTVNELTLIAGWTGGTPAPGAFSIGSMTFPISSISVIQVTTTLVVNEWVGANWRNGSPATLPRTGYGTVVGNSAGSITVVWAGSVGEPTIPDQMSVAGYLTRDDERWKSYENIRVLTPYQPEILNESASGPTIPYPSGTPVIPGYVVPPNITSYADLGLFLNLTFLEGVDGDGAIGTGVWVAAASVYVDVSAHLCAQITNVLVGGYIRAGNSRARIASNTANRSATVTFTAAGSPEINWAAHLFTVSDIGYPVVFTNSGGALPAEISAGVTYYVQAVPTGGTINISAAPGGPAITFAGAGTPTHTGHAAGSITIVDGAAGWTGGVPSSSQASAYQAWVGHYNNNPHAWNPGDGFRYPNNDMMPSAFATSSQGTIHNRPRGEDALGGSGTPSAIFANFSYGDRFGAMIEHAFRVSTLIGRRVNVIHLGINSAQQFLRNTQNFFGFKGQIGWWDYNKHLDWTPGNPDGCAERLRRLITVMAPAAIQMQGDNPLKIIDICGLQGEGDAIVEIGRETYGTSLRSFYDWLRETIAEAGLSLWGKDRTPVTHAKITTTPWGLVGFYPTYGVTLDGDSGGLVNAAIVEMARQDPYATFWETEDLPKLASDLGHFNGVGEARNGKRSAEAWQAVAMRAASAAPTFDIPTLAEMRSRVLDVAQRNQNSTDTGVIETVNRAINDALHSFLGECGDIAWFLRRTERMTLTGSPTTVTEMPALVRRLIEVRDTGDPLQEYNFTLRGFGSNGRMLVTFLEDLPGTVDVVHIYQPRDLETDDDRPIIPREYVEAVVVSAARRLLSQSGNAALEIKVAAREEKLLLRANEHCQKVFRALRQKVSGNRTKGVAVSRFISDGPPDFVGY